jgi:hypothetical protein
VYAELYRTQFERQADTDGAAGPEGQPDDHEVPALTAGDG